MIGKLKQNFSEYMIYDIERHFYRYIWIDSHYRDCTMGWVIEELWFISCRGSTPPLFNGYWGMQQVMCEADRSPRSCGEG